MKRVLVIAYYFPPSGGAAAAAAQRILRLIKYLPDYGWEVSVLTVREDHYEPSIQLDSTLMGKVPPTIEVRRTIQWRGAKRLLSVRQRFMKAIRFGRLMQDTADRPLAFANRSTVQPNNIPVRCYQALKHALTDLLEIPDTAMGWTFPAIIEGWRAIRERQIDVILATGRPWDCHVIGLALSALTGRPLVTDFRDPWTTNPYLSRYSFPKEWANKRLEYLSIKRSRYVLTTTVELSAEFAKRFPDEPADKWVSLPSGFDSEDVTLARFVKRSNIVFTIVHVGFFYLKRDPKNFFLGLRMAIDEGWINSELVRFIQVGGTNVDYDIEAFLKSHDLDKSVELHGQVSYERAQEMLWEAHCPLLLQPGTMTQVPSKIFEYMTTAQPILAIVESEGAAGRLVLTHNLGLVAHPDDPRQIAQALGDLYAAWMRNPKQVGVAHENLELFEAKTIGSKLADLLTAAMA